MEKPMSSSLLTQLAVLAKKGVRINFQQKFLEEISAELHQTLRQHEELKIRYDLISRLLAARPVNNDGQKQFYALLEHDFMVFSETVSMKFEAKSLKILQSIGHELEMLVGSPDVRKRNVVAIVGGFSSGKSEFINSFIQDQSVRLSVGIQPVTVIPSYVYATDVTQPVILGYSSRHGRTEIDGEFYQGLSHAFIDSFDFNLRELMPFVSLGVKMDAQYFGHLCFIDTPGYNPPMTSSHHSEQDKNTAVEFAQQANALVWLIGLDATGTVPQSDIDFLHEITCEGQPIYVVLNKADLKPEDQIESIMDEVEEILTDEGLDVHGICAYSSVRRHAYGHRKLSLMDFFSHINKPGNVSDQLYQRLDEVFDQYVEAIQSDIASAKARRLSLYGLRNDMLEFTGDFDVLEKLEERIGDLTGDTDTRHLEKMLEETRILHEKFIEAVALSVGSRPPPPREPA